MALLAVRATLLIGPTALAFGSGGYFRTGRLVAAIVMWAAFALAALAAPRLTITKPIAAALGGMVLFTAWTILSITWAPLREPAADAAERAVLYLGALLAATLALRPRSVARLAEPVLAGGILTVVGYGLAGRVLPDLVELSRTASAGGRLDQPLTYWNAEGALAAIGVVLVARIAGDRSRPLALRVAAAAAAAPLGLGVYLTFSRGALTALAVGLAVLLAMAHGWAQLRSIAIALEAGIACAIVASFLPAVQDAEGDHMTVEGLGMLAALLVIAAAAGALQRWSARAEEDGSTRTGPLPHFSRVSALAWAAAVLLAAAPFVAGVIDRGKPPTSPTFGATADRFRSAGSYRYAYWQAALKGFADDPAVGAGAGSFAVTWLEKRTIDDTVRDAHSLELETAAELGLIGLALLLLTLGGIAWAATRMAFIDPGLAAGPIAAVSTWAAHSAIDWDWEMPALTLVAVVLAGLLLAQLSEQAPLVAQRDEREDASEDGDLGDGLPERPVTAPQRPAYG